MFSKSERTLEKIGMESDSVSQCKLLENSVRSIDNVVNEKEKCSIDEFDLGMPSQFRYGRSAIDTVS